MKVLEQYTNDINRLCSEYKVKHLYVFGSILTDNFSKESDIDLIVTFDNVDIDNYADNYFNLKFSLQDILERPVDLLEEKAIKNPYFLKEINQKRKLLYAA